ncbi:MAG: prolipoprotein diacylglyceryl transferase [Lachnospiraceae bacterium]|nr:prolipoprotein diacylglyceryl transferase [Lachnospiraceae bacterium]
MYSGDISFPHLGIELHNVPQGFTVFGIEIKWYGVLVALGMIAGIATALRQAKKEHLDTELIWDFAVPAILFGVIGARIYYVVFFWEMYRDDPLSVFNIRAGGLAIYGGVIAAILTCFIFTKIKKISFLQFLDVCIPGLIIGQVIGRWGNFVNREVFGRYTDGLFAMRLPIVDVRSRDVTLELAEHMFTEGVNYIQVMPTFLYESVLNLIVFLIMILYRKHKKFQGEITLIYLGGYGIVRFFIEGLRTDRLLLWNTNIAVSQLLGILLFLFAVGAEIVVRVCMTTRKKVLAGLEEDMQEKWGQTESSRTEADQSESDCTAEEQTESNRTEEKQAESDRAEDEQEEST